MPEPNVIKHPMTACLAMTARRHHASSSKVVLGCEITVYLHLLAMGQLRKLLAVITRHNAPACPIAGFLCIHSSLEGPPYALHVMQLTLTGSPHLLPSP